MPGQDSLPASLACGNDTGRGIPGRGDAHGSRLRSIISAKVAFWMIAKPVPNRHMPAITAAGEAGQIMAVIPRDAIASPGTSRRA